MEKLQEYDLGRAVILEDGEGDVEVVCMSCKKVQHVASYPEPNKVPICKPCKIRMIQTAAAKQGFHLGV